MAVIKIDDMNHKLVVKGGMIYIFFGALGYLSHYLLSGQKACYFLHGVPRTVGTIKLAGNKKSLSNLLRLSM
jgi:hypothetical protein